MSAGIAALAASENDHPTASSPHGTLQRPVVPAAALVAVLSPSPTPTPPPPPAPTPQPAPVIPVRPDAPPSPRGCPSGYVALTFDDGPSPTYTNPLIDYLVAAKVPATFFVQGSRVQANPQPTQRAFVLGFSVGNHTWNHPRLPDLTPDAIAWQLNATTQALGAIGVRSGTLMRSPYGADTPAIVAQIKSMGMIPVGWTDDSRDYADGTPPVIAQRVLAGLKPHIFNQVLVHDGIDTPQADGRVASAQTLQAVPAIVDGARAAGYCFTQFALSGRPMIPAPVWGPNGWVASPSRR